jgi:SAM-dependent methyltransferase
MDLGAGFGRLADLYDGYRRVVLFDFSRSQLQYARSQLGDERFVYVAGDMYRLPFVAGLFDAVNQVRVIHHAADPAAVFAEVRRVVRPDGVFLLEFANKRNLKAIARYLLRRQAWSPFDLQPVEFVDLNFDLHPSWVRRELTSAGFLPGQLLTVSHFRLGLLKRRVPTRWLVQADRLLQFTGRLWQLTPSVFVCSRASASGVVALTGTFFACPACQCPLPTPQALVEGSAPANGELVCRPCGRTWPISAGVYDFKGV